MAKFLHSMILCSLGFLLGWLANDWLKPSSADLDNLASESSISYRSSSAPQSSTNPTSSEQVFTGTPQRDKPTHSSTPEKLIYAEANEEENTQLRKAADLVDEFKLLIDNGEYEQAVIFYGRYRYLSDVEPLIRSVLRNSLRAFADSGHSERFSGLADAWLASYYSDAEILLLVAKQHRAMDYLQEALSVLQLAMTYSHGKEKSTSYKALQEFVQDTDSELSRENAWLRLQAFYETLISMELDSDEDRLRLAEIYLFNGKEGAGRQLLSEIGDDSLKGRAENILQRYDSETSEFQPLENRKKQFVSRLPMKRMGRHYILPLLSERGDKVELLLDTGASTTLLSVQAFRRFSRAGKAEYLGQRIFNTANGLSQGYAYRMPAVTFGPFELQDLEISVSDTDFGGEFDGLLGMNVLQQFTFQIDQVNSELLLNRR